MIATLKRRARLRWFRDRLRQERELRRQAREEWERLVNSSHEYHGWAIVRVRPWWRVVCPVSPAVAAPAPFADVVGAMRWAEENSRRAA